MWTQIKLHFLSLKYNDKYLNIKIIKDIYSIRQINTILFCILFLNKLNYYVYK